MESVRPIKVNILMEAFVGKTNGVYTAFIETIEALRNHKEVSVRVNSKEPYDIAHFHSMGLYYLWKSFSHRGQLLLTAHVVPGSLIGSLVLGHFWSPIAKFYLKFAYNRADVVLPVSLLVEQELREIGVRKPLRTICNSVDTETFHPNEERREEYRDKLGFTQNDAVVLGVGQIQPRKGIDNFVEVATRLPRAKFVWIGAQLYGHLATQRHAMQRILNNAPQNVIFAGSISFQQMPGYYNAADVFFLPSHQENFPFALLEAAASELPLVLRDNPEYRFILSDHYLKANSVDGFCSLIKRLLDDPNQLRSYQRHSELLAKQYDKKAYAAKLISLYQDVYRNKVQ